MYMGRNTDDYEDNASRSGGRNAALATGRGRGAELVIF
jgi:hypothetical protein